MNIQERNRHDVTYLAADGMEAAGGIAHGFSTRLGGISSAPFDSLDLGYNRGDDPTSHSLLLPGCPQYTIVLKQLMC